MNKVLTPPRLTQAILCLFLGRKFFDAMRTVLRKGGYGAITIEFAPDRPLIIKTTVHERADCPIPQQFIKRD